MIHLKKLIMTLALLLTAATGAWADESETITTATKNTTVYTGTHFKITASYICDANGIYLFSNNNHGKATIESLNGENITKIEMHMTCGGKNATKTTTTAGQLVATNSSVSANDISVINVNATSVEIGTTVEASDVTDVQIDKFVIYYGPAPTPVDLTRGTGEKINEWTLTNGMPAGNVLLTVAYKDRATMALTYGGTAITTEANAVTAFKGFEQEFAEALTPAVQNIEPTFNSGTAQDVTTTLAADFTFKSSDAGIIGFKTGETYADEGTLDQMEFRALTTTPVTLTVTYKGTDDLESKSQALLVTIEKKTYTVSLADGTEDAGNWSIEPKEGLSEGDQVTIQYNGRLKVKGVKATSDAAPAEAVLSITSPSVGQVIGSDGKNYAYGSLPSGVTAVAKICYVSGSNGLALALTDEKSGSTMNWSTAQTTCAAHTAPFTGGTWKLASKDEWINMIAAAGSDLRDGFSSVGGTNMQEGRYWSSTEYESVSSAAYYYDFYDPSWNADNKNSDGYVRACLAF